MAPLPLRLRFARNNHANYAIAFISGNAAKRWGNAWNCLQDVAGACDA